MFAVSSLAEPAPSSLSSLKLSVKREPDDYSFTSAVNRVFTPHLYPTNFCEPFLHTNN
jgi:hypothetical protein